MHTFNKIACFTDIHFGEHRDDEEHNKLCIEFLYWFKENAIKNDCDAVCFLGDWHHTRNKVGVNTLFYSKMGLDILNSIGVPVYFILGNHDIYYQDSRRVHSLPFAHYLSNIVIIDKPTKVGDTLFVPWIVSEDDKKSMRDDTIRYIFGHFEFPGFMMNAMVESPEREDSLTIDFFQHPEFIFSGHFHKRQQKKHKNSTIIYMGNAFPHNFADEGDTERGMMIMVRDNVPFFLDWSDMPVYNRVKLSELMEHKIHKRSVIKIIPDIDITKDDRAELLEIMSENNPGSKITMEPVRKDTNNEISVEDIEGQTVESIIMEYLKDSDHGELNNSKLLEIYMKA